MFIFWTDAQIRAPHRRKCFTYATSQRRTFHKTSWNKSPVMFFIHIFKRFCRTNWRKNDLNVRTREQPFRLNCNSKNVSHAKCCGKNCDLYLVSSWLSLTQLTDRNLFAWHLMGLDALSEESSCPWTFDDLPIRNAKTMFAKKNTQMFPMLMNFYPWTFCRSAPTTPSSGYGVKVNTTTNCSKTEAIHIKVTHAASISYYTCIWEKADWRMFRNLVTAMATSFLIGRLNDWDLFNPHTRPLLTVLFLSFNYFWLLETFTSFPSEKRATIFTMPGKIRSTLHWPLSRKRRS